MIVLDASAAVAIVLRTEEGQALQSLVWPGEAVLTSELFYAEVCNVFWKYVKAGICERGEAARRIEDALSLIDDFIPLSDNYIEAMSAASVYDHPVYDMLYATAARRYGATLFTLDRRLIEVCDKMGIGVAGAKA